MTTLPPGTGFAPSITQVIPPPKPDPFDFSPELSAALKEKYAAGATNAEWTIFIEMCKRRRLVPGTQVHLLMRKVWEYDEELRKKVPQKRATYVSSIDSFRIVAQRSGEYQGPEPATYVYYNEKTGEPRGSDFDESQYPLPGRNLYGVKFTVHRRGFAVPTTVFARYDAYVVTYKKDNVEHVQEIWERRGPEQNAKCAEALALRQAFPEDLSELYTFDEMAKAFSESEPAPEEKPKEPQTSASPEPVAAPGPVSEQPAAEKPSRPQSDKELEKPKAPKKAKKEETKEPPKEQPALPPEDKKPEPKPEEKPAEQPPQEKSELDAWPTPSTKLGQLAQPDLQRLYDGAKDVGYLLANAGLAPSAGITTGAKLKRYILAKNNAKELADLTVAQWDETLNGLKALLGKDETKKQAVEAVDSAWTPAKK